MTERPVRRSNSATTSAGKPFGYGGKALARCTPAISQCPVVLSFPADRGTIRPHAPIADSFGATPSSGAGVSGSGGPERGGAAPPRRADRRFFRRDAVERRDVSESGALEMRQVHAADGAGQVAQRIAADIAP